MLYSLEEVRANLRNREGKRVFYLGKGDQLTSQARDVLARERIEILPADRAKPDEYRLLTGGTVTEKPEHMTHLHGNVLVMKTHPRIAFRGAIDTLEAELLLAQRALCKPYDGQVGEVLEFARRLIRCDVLDEQVEDDKEDSENDAEGDKEVTSSGYVSKPQNNDTDDADIIDAYVKELEKLDRGETPEFK